jgi:primosomal protein N' (replication factor Y)
MPVYCEVALPVPLDHTFTYAVRVGQKPQRGARVIAPFRNEKLIGVVTGLNVKAPADVEMRYLEAVLDEEPLLSEQLMGLAEWMAGYYLAPLGEVLRGMLPLMAEVRRTVYFRITDLGRDVLANRVEGDSNSQVRESGPFDRLRAGSGAPGVSSGGPKRRGKLSAEEMDLELRVLTRLADGDAVKVSSLRTATAATLPVLAGLLRKKWIARETAAVERDARRRERFAVLIPETRLPSLTEKQQAILAELAACGGELPLAELRRKDLPSSTLQTLVRRGLVKIDERAAAFRMGGLQPTMTEPFKLNPPQLDALASVVSALGTFHPFLLFGVTGSGKTAVYLEAMQRALDRGLASILLVPEIGLTPQTVGLLDAAFGSNVALLHSALTPE